MAEAEENPQVGEIPDDKDEQLNRDTRELASNAKNLFALVQNGDESQAKELATDLLNELKANPKKFKLTAEKKEELRGLVKLISEGKQGEAMTLISDRVGKSHTDKISEFFKTIDDSSGTLMKKGTSVVSLLSEGKTTEALAASKALVQEFKNNSSLQELLKGDGATKLKSFVVPFIQEHMLTMDIPPVRGQYDLGYYTGGKVKYGVANLRLSKLLIPVSLVDIKYDEANNRVMIVVTGIEAVLQKFKWAYDQEGFPYLADSGSCNATVKGGQGTITFEVSWSGNLPQLQIKAIMFKLEDIIMDVADSSASWIYNKLLSLFGEKIKKATEAELIAIVSRNGHLLCEKLNKFLEDFTKEGEENGGEKEDEKETLQIEMEDDSNGEV